MNGPNPPHALIVNWYEQYTSDTSFNLVKSLIYFYPPLCSLGDRDVPAYEGAYVHDLRSEQ